MPWLTLIEPTGIKWNKETWYSRMVSIVLFFGAIPILCFDIGVQYWQAETALTSYAQTPGINYPHPISILEKTINATATSTAP